MWVGWLFIGSNSSFSGARGEIPSRIQLITLIPTQFNTFDFLLFSISPYDDNNNKNKIMFGD